MKLFALASVCLAALCLSLCPAAFAAQDDGELPPPQARYRPDFSAELPDMPPPEGGDEAAPAAPAPAQAEKADDMPVAHERTTTVSDRKHLASWPQVIDGDTFTAMLDTAVQATVRLYGIDAPDEDQPMGGEAARALAGLLAGRKVELTITGRDHEGRTVALVFADGQSVNEAMLGGGLAYVHPKGCRDDFCPEWVALEQRARLENKGVWAEPGATPPWQWRAERAGAEAEWAEALGAEQDAGEEQP